MHQIYQEERGRGTALDGLLFSSLWPRLLFGWAGRDFIMSATSEKGSLPFFWLGSILLINVQ